MSIQGHVLVVRVEYGVNFKQKGTHVCISYNNEIYRTSTATDGGNSPKFHEIFRILLVDGGRELSIAVRRKCTFGSEEVIATGKVQLDKVLRDGNDESLWPLKYTTKSGEVRNGGEIKLAMEYKGSKVAPPRELPPPLPSHCSHCDHDHPISASQFPPCPVQFPASPLHPSFDNRHVHHASPYLAPPSPYNNPAAPGPSAWPGYQHGHHGW